MVRGGEGGGGMCVGEYSQLNEVASVSTKINVRFQSINQNVLKLKNVQFPKFNEIQLRQLHFPKFNEI